MYFSCSDNDDFRIPRLHRAARILFEINPDLQDKIVCLHDHEGSFYIGWKEIPTEWEKKTLVGVWENVGEVDVHHYVGDEIDF